MLKALMWVLLFYSQGLHPVHVSVTHIEYNQSSRRFQVSIKVFTDDFQEMILQKYGRVLEADRDWNSPADKEAIGRYFNESFGLEANGKKELTLSYTGMKQNEEAVWLEFETPAVRNPGELVIRNRILLDLFHDQTNLVILGVASFEKGYRFSHRIQETKVMLD